MTFRLRIGRFELDVEARRAPAEPGDVEVVFLNPQEDTAEARAFIDELHRDLGSYNQ